MAGDWPPGRGGGVAFGKPQGFWAGKICQQKALACLDKSLILNQKRERLQVGKQFKHFFPFENNHEFLTINPKERQWDSNCDTRDFSIAHSPGWIVRWGHFGDWTLTPGAEERGLTRPQGIQEKRQVSIANIWGSGISVSQAAWENDQFGCWQEGNQCARFCWPWGKKSTLVHLARIVRAPVGCCLKPQFKLSLRVREKVCSEGIPPEHSFAP